MSLRKDRKIKGAEYRRILGQPDHDPGLLAPGYRDFVDEFFYDGIGARTTLEMSDRFIPILTAVCLNFNPGATKRLIAAALDKMLPPRAIVEIFIQVALYGGLPNTETALQISAEVFATRGIDLAENDNDQRTLEELDTDGARVMQELHGPRQDGGYASPNNPVTFALYQTAIRHGYGNLWMRPGLDLRQRTLCAIAGFTCIKLHGSLRKFAVSALNVGLSKDQVAEAAIQTAPWNSFPIALDALTVISEALDSVE